MCTCIFSVIIHAAVVCELWNRNRNKFGTQRVSSSNNKQSA